MTIVMYGYRPTNIATCATRGYGQTDGRNNVATYRATITAKLTNITSYVAAITTNKTLCITIFYYGTILFYH